MSFVVAMLVMWLVGGLLVAGVLAFCIAEGRPRRRTERLAAERPPQPMPGPATVIEQAPAKLPARRPGWAT